MCIQAEEKLSGIKLFNRQEKGKIKMYDDKNIDALVAERKRILFRPRYKDSCLSKISLPSDKQESLKKFLHNPRNILLYSGNPGIGKTYFCSALIEWAMKKMRSFRYYREYNILSLLRENMQKSSGGDYLAYLETLIDDDLIILDDVGSSGLNEWREEVFFNFLDYRYETMKPTIITSNFSSKDFSEKYSPRVADRLFASENTIIEIENGESLRKQGL